MKKNLLSWVCLILLLVNVVYAYFQYRETQASGLLLERLRTEYSNHIFDLEIQKEDRKQELTFNGRAIDMNQTLMNMDNQTVRLSDIISSPKLILRYSEMNCDICIEAQVRNLNRLADSVGVRQIVLFVTYRDSQNMKRFIETHRVKFAVYKLDNELASTLADIEMPYYFILTPDEGRVQCMFIPHKENPELMKYYLNQIKRKFFD